MLRHQRRVILPGDTVDPVNTFRHAQGVRQGDGVDALRRLHSRLADIIAELLTDKGAGVAQRGHILLAAGKQADVKEGHRKSLV